MWTRPAKAGLTLAVLAALAIPTGLSFAVGADQSTLVNVTPSTATPNINDGNVYAIAQVGSRIIVGGSFTNANPPGDTNAAHTVTRRNVLAFDAATGQIDTGFVPTLDGEVRALLPGPSPDTVYVGGYFNNVNGAKGKGVELLSTVTGHVVAGFVPAAMDGAVWAISLVGSHLVIGGTFTKLGTVAHGGIAALNPTTGAADNSYTTVQVSGHHNFNGTSGANAAIGVHEMDASPDGTRLVAVGNFKNVNGALHDQIVILDLGASATVDPNWNTSRYTAKCSSGSFDTYMRGVSFSPDGTYFVVAATGGSTNSLNTDGTRSLCDTAARWTTTATGTNVAPVWIDWSGNDSLESVTVTSTAIYIGGHFRWLNNSNCSDCAGTGAVPRPGLAALDPANGMPFAWNPGRNPRGAGAYWVLATPQGLYIGADTDSIGTGNTFVTRKRIAFFPLAGGEAVTAFQPAPLPADIYLAGKVSGTNVDTLQERFFTGSSAGATSTVDNSTVAWSQVRGAFMAGNTLYYGYSDNKLHQASFDGTTVGTPSVVDPYDDPIWSNVDTGSGQTYRGKAPTLYGTEMQTVTGMLLSNGRLYYALSGKTALRYRYFEPDDGIVGSDEFTAAGNVNFTNIAGMFISGDTLYYADKATGNLHAVAWNNGAPNASTDTVVSGPGLDGNDWRTRGMFALTATAPTTPTASFVSSCTGLTCSFDGSSSVAPGDTITSYAWDFGDGGTDSGATSSHTFATSGTYQVRLTITTAGSQQASTTQPVSPNDNAQPINFVATASTNGNATTEAVTVPAGVDAGDGMLLLATSANGTAPTAPTGWTLVARSPSNVTAMTTVLYRKVATGGDAGGTVSVGFGGTVHGTVQLVAYRGTNSANPVQQASVATVANATSVTSPTVGIGTGGTWVVTYWVGKSSAVTGWTTPPSQTSRGVANGSGSGRINSVIVDGGGPAPTGNAGGLTATTDQTASAAASWTIVLTS